MCPVHVFNTCAQFMSSVAAGKCIDTESRCQHIEQACQDHHISFLSIGVS